MQHIVLDTNSLIMAISSRNRYHKVWQTFLQGDYILCITNEIIEEYYEVIARNINRQVAGKPGSLSSETVHGRSICQRPDMRKREEIAGKR